MFGMNIKPLPDKAMMAGHGVIGRYKLLIGNL
jgi:hypothetical protein